MTNAEIRKRAWGLFKANYWRIGAVMLGVFLIETAPDIVCYLLSITPPSWTDLVWSVLISPITTLGVAWYALCIWEGHAPDTNRIMAFISPAGVLFRAFGLNIAQGVLTAGILLLPPTLLMMMGSGSMGLFVALFIAAIAVMLWILLRLSLAPLLFIRDPEHRPLAALGASWRYAKGSLGRIIAMQIMVAWPYFLVMLAANLLTGRASLAWLSLLLTPLIGLIYYGYVWLATTGLFAELIREAEPGEPDGGEAA